MFFSPVTLGITIATSRLTLFCPVVQWTLVGSCPAGALSSLAFCCPLHLIQTLTSAFLCYQDASLGLLIRFLGISALSCPRSHFRKHFCEFPGGPVVTTLYFHTTGAQVCFLVQELRSHMSQKVQVKSLSCVRLFVTHER